MDKIKNSKLDINKIKYNIDKFLDKDDTQKAIYMNEIYENINLYLFESGIGVDHMVVILDTVKKCLLIAVDNIKEKESKGE